MKGEELSLDDIALFQAVCEAGGLAGAVARSGFSAPTLSRRMTVLERQAGQRLFQRGNHGYALTSAGRDLYEEAQGLSHLRRRLQSWMQTAPRPQVRITAGTWTSRWMAQNLNAYWTQSDPWVPAFLSNNAAMDIARREADIGIRNRAPEQSWLAGRRLRRIHFAEFAATDEVKGYVTLADEAASTPSTRWVHEQKGQDIVTTVNDIRMALDMACAGVARVVLPIFAGAAEANVTQVSDPIEELTHDEWLVTHHDARYDPPIRRAIDSITRFIEGKS
ncbi:MAG: LysR family transcriptional regulator [Pseudomonadota bacterium]